MSTARRLRIAEEPDPQRRLTGDHWWDPDRERHLRDHPRHCPECGAAIDDELGMVVEYWEGEQRIYHTWCRACGWAGEVVKVDRVIGHEPEH